MFDYQRVDSGPWFRFRGRKGVEVSVVSVVAAMTARYRREV